MIKSLYTTTGPSIEPVTPEEAKLFCKIDGSVDDSIVEGLIQAAREGSEKRTGRAYITQTVKAVIETSSTFIVLPRPPFSAVSTVKYLDGTETWQAMTSSTDYYVATRGQVGTLTLLTAPFINNEGKVVLEVVYSAGYGATAASVPQALKQAILLRVAAMYDNRGGGELDFSGAHKLEAPYRLVLP